MIATTNTKDQDQGDKAFGLGDNLAFPGGFVTPPSTTGTTGTDINPATGRRSIKTGLTNAQIAQIGTSSAPLGASASTTAMSAAGSSPIAINNQVADNNLGYRLNQGALLQPTLVNSLEMGNDVSNSQYALSQDKANLAGTVQQDYLQSWRPVTNQFVSEASAYGNEADQAAAAARAGANVDAAAADARATSARQMASMGINPNSGKFAGVMASGDVTTAAQKAAQMTAAATDAKDKGIALRQQAAQMGNTALSTGNSVASTAASLGTSAANTVNTGVTDVLNTTSMVGQGFNAQQNAQATAQGAADNAASRALSQERYDAAKDAADAAAWAQGAAAIGSIIGSLWG